MKCRTVESCYFVIVLLFGPFPEGLQYRADPWRELSKPSGISPQTKNQFNIEAAMEAAYQILS